MRLIDADVLIKRMKPVAEYEYNDTRRKAFNEILDYVQKMPTAYDVEAVDRQLRERLLESLNSANDEMIDNGHTLKWENFFGKKEAYETAISIVRGKE